MAFCTNCGTQEQEGQRFCPVCGKATAATGVPASAMAPMPPPSRTEAPPEARVTLGLCLDPPRQARWTILLRLFLSLPLFIVMELVIFAASIATIGSWFSALFTKRVPDSLQNFVAGALRFSSNVYAYAFLLVPRWPGVSLDERPNDQVTLSIDHVDLNRGAVLFRFLLAIPAFFVSALVSYGVYLVVFVMWIWGLFAGRTPRALHQGAALALRFQIRTQSYYLLLTPMQPFRGFLGDGRELATDNTSENPSASLSTRWFTSNGARVALVVMLFVPLGGSILQSTFGNPIGNRFETVISRTILRASNSQVNTDVTNFEQSVQSCGTSNLRSCTGNAAGVAFSALSNDEGVIDENIFLPPRALSAKQNYKAQLGSMETILYAIQVAPSSADQLKLLREFSTAYKKFKADYATLVSRDSY